MTGKGWLRKSSYAILLLVFVVIMYKNLQHWSEGQMNIAYSLQSAETLQYPSITVCPYQYNLLGNNESSSGDDESESIMNERRLISLHHVVENKLNCVFNMGDPILPNHFYLRTILINSKHPDVNETYVTAHKSYNILTGKVINCFTYNAQGKSRGGNEGQVNRNTGHYDH